MAISGKELIKHIEEIAPPRFAVEKDRIGLQLGNPNKKVLKMLVALEVTEQVVKEAIELGIDFIFVHHALIYQPLAQIRTDYPAGRIIEQLIEHQIAVYVAHTNLDVASGGVNDVLAAKIGLLQPKTLLIHSQEPLLKLVVFVPKTHLEKVRQALGDSGAGSIGDYSHCTFAAEGKGTFLPHAGTNPFIGEQGQLSEVEEFRLETVMPASLQEKVIQAMLAVHPYEEVAYEIYPLALSESIGMGKIGTLSHSIFLSDFISQVKQAYELSHVRVVGDLQTKVRTIALLGGAGSRYVSEAKRQGADVYITGDIDYHTAQAALQDGVCLIDVGHHVEQLVVPAVVKLLDERLHGQLSIFASKVDFNPFQTC